MYAKSIEEYATLNGQGVTLYPYQKKFLNDGSKFRIVNKSRQTGFSTIVAFEALFSCFKGHQTILIISSSERQSVHLMYYIKQAYHGLPADIRNYGEYKLVEETKTTMKFANGSEIYSLPASPHTIVGFRAHHIYFDEFAHMQNDREIWTALTPSISRGGRVTIISTPLGNLNLFYDLWHDQTGAWSKHKIMWHECHHLDVTEIKKTMDETSFNQEYCCEFVDESVSIFPYKLIKPCVNNALTNVTRFDDGKQHILYMGVDFAKKKDYTTIVVVEKTLTKDKKTFFTTRYIKNLRKMNYSLIIHFIKERATTMGVSKIVVDQTGVGEKLWEELKSKMGGLVKGVVFTSKSKERMVVDLKILLEDKRILLPDDKTLIEHLHNLRKDLTKAGNIIISHRQGTHDDYAWALMLSVFRGSMGTGFFGSKSIKRY